MDSPALECWSFVYVVGGARYSTEILAPTRQEAEARVKALASARCEGAIIPDASATDETLRLSA